MAGMEQKPKIVLSLEEQLERIRGDIGDIQSDVRQMNQTQDILVNYIRLLIKERGLQQEARHLEKQIEAMRAKPLPGTSR